MKLDLIEFYLKHGIYHSATPDHMKRSIRKAKSTYLIKGGKLIYTGKGKQQIVCRNEQEKMDALLWCHYNRTNNTRRCNKRDTYRLLKKVFYWEHMSTDILHEVYKCKICRTYDSNISSKEPPDELENESTSSHVAELLKEEQKRIFEDEDELSSNDNSNTDHPSKKVLSLEDTILVNESNFAVENKDQPPQITIAPKSVGELFDRISVLEALNADMALENKSLKAQIKSMHRMIENQSDVPVLKDLINELKQIMPKTAATSSTQFSCCQQFDESP